MATRLVTNHITLTKTSQNHILKWGGRIVTQRDDQDQEPCYYIDINLFKKLRKNI